jgi:hypothetical protein
MYRLFRLPTRVFLTALLTAAAATSQGPWRHSKGTGIVRSIVKAPIVADGDVAGAPTDLVINLKVDMDPAKPGLTLLKGKKFKVTLPASFKNLGKPIGPPASGNNFGVLLQGWPQNPIPPVPANYTHSFEGTHTFVYTAARDLKPGDKTLNGPGLKQAHVLLVGFRNPKPGIYWVRVDAETGPGGKVQSGKAPVIIWPRARPSINVTSIFAGPRPFANTIYQKAKPNGKIPIPWNFLMWDRRGQPALGVTIRQFSRNHAFLVRGRRIVGLVSIRAPRGARGQRVSSQGPSSPMNAPVLGKATGRLTTDFRAGNRPGNYVITFRMSFFQSVRMHVKVE